MGPRQGLFVVYSAWPRLNVSSKLKTYQPEILQISIISESDRFGIEKHITTHPFDRLRPFCAQFVVWGRDKVCSWCIVHGHDSRCDLSSKPIEQKFFELASSARATDLALKNILQPILLIDCAHFVLSLWYGAETRFVRGV